MSSWMGYEPPVYYTGIEAPDNMGEMDETAPDGAYDADSAGVDGLDNGAATASPVAAVDGVDHAARFGQAIDTSAAQVQSKKGASLLQQLPGIFSKPVQSLNDIVDLTNQGDSCHFGSSK